MNKSRQRKIAYLLAIVVLFSGLIGLSNYINRAAEKHKLAQKSLGNVNPVSGTAQLVFVGMRGVAVTFLWYEAIELKKKQRWFEIRPVLESITLLQPNFVEPWTFQSWNMAYNIAAEWESVDDKYYWIRQGIDFMKRAVQANNDKMDMEWYVAWLYHNRFGMSDEKMYLRELFRNDPDGSFNISKDKGLKDNYLVAYDWFVVANETIRRLQQKPKSKGITPFMSYTALSWVGYADFKYKDGIFGDETKAAWRRAHEEWIKFGLEGGKDKDKDLKLRLEYTDEQRKALTEDERFWLERYENMIHYPYWRKRTLAETDDNMQIARQSFYNAEKARKAGNYKTAITEYESAFKVWRGIMEKDENLRTDTLFIDLSQEYEHHYLRLLERLDLPLPEKRPFEGLFQAYEDLAAPPAIEPTIPDEPVKKPMLEPKTQDQIRAEKIKAEAEQKAKAEPTETPKPAPK